MDNNRKQLVIPMSPKKVTNYKLENKIIFLKKRTLFDLCKVHALRLPASLKLRFVLQTGLERTYSQ